MCTGIDSCMLETLDIAISMIGVSLFVSIIGGTILGVYMLFVKY